MPTYAIYLKPKTSYVSPIGSDTLFGAFCWAMRMLHGEGELEALLQRFIAASASGILPPFALSTAFPFFASGKTVVPLYPKPLVLELTSTQIPPVARRDQQRHSGLRRLQRATVAVIDKAKQVKGARFLSEELFHRIISGEMDSMLLCEQLTNRGSVDSDVVHWGDVLITHGELKKLQAEDLAPRIAAHDMQRNEIERVASSPVEGRLFFSHEIVLHREKAGLWFALRTEDLDLIRPLLRYLADTGIGGERSTGKGHFTIPLDEIHEVKLPEADEPNCFVSLSRYIPVDGECDFTRDPLAYTLTPSRPKHEATLAGLGHRTYKRLLRLLEPGSCFPFQLYKDVYGRLVDVGPSANLNGFLAYHNGLAVPVFAKLRGMA